ncbi:MAG: NAD(P)-dependent oxidoreductase [Rhodospirillum sp.]|nr:NAD(P)-dependent oxidoreductase [Rhodospirillum sp.]MCF8489163.1 NAD(P)-dependent oxidoreductase [Rhodospirillum sp.]MCF8499830.1 NAD(P)-dependent oxidoreductase [Rhodospirillum sp.]
MGLPMARRLTTAGLDCWGLDIRPLTEFGAFAARMLPSPRKMAARCPVVLSVVRDRIETETLCFGEDGLFASTPYPKVFVICSTLAPVDVLEIAARLPRDVVTVDAAISGAPIAAEEGTLTVMMGGPPDTTEALEPLFTPMARAIHRLGPLGAGMTVKVLNNFVAASTVVAVRRAFSAADSLGLDWRTLRDVMASSSGGTWFGTNYERISWANEGWEKGNTMGILEKDVKAYLTTVLSTEGRDPNAFETAVLEGLKDMPPVDR